MPVSKADSAYVPREKLTEYLLNVFGSWCPTCQEEHPILTAKIKPLGIRIVGLDWRDPPESGKGWLQQFGNPYELVLNDDQIAALKQQLRTRAGREVTIDAEVDPNILGGIVVKLGSQQIDASIRTKLNRLAQAMKG